MIFVTLMIFAAGFSQCLCQSPTTTPNSTSYMSPQESTTRYDVENQSTIKRYINYTKAAGTTEEIPFKYSRIFSTLVKGTRNEIKLNNTMIVKQSTTSSRFVKAKRGGTAEITTVASQTTVTEETPGNISHTDFYIIVPANNENIIAPNVEETSSETLASTPIIETISGEDSTNNFRFLLNKTEEKEEIEERTSDSTVPEPDKEITEDITEIKEDITEDLVEKQINEAINSMPKLPELVLSDNKTHFKFHKNSQEMLMDEKITKIARELAEKSLREKYEERKLGYLAVKKSKKSEESKPYKFKKPKVPTVNENQRLSSPKVQTTEFLDFKFVGMDKKSGSTKAITKGTATETYETVTNLPFILKFNKSASQIKEITKMLKMKSEESNPDLQHKTPVPEILTTSVKYTSMAPITTDTPSIPIDFLKKEKQQVPAPPINITLYTNKLAPINKSNVKS